MSTNVVEVGRISVSV